MFDFHEPNCVIRVKTLLDIKSMTEYSQAEDGMPIYTKPGEVFQYTGEAERIANVTPYFRELECFEDTFTKEGNPEQFKKDEKVYFYRDIVFPEWAVEKVRELW